MKSVSINSLRIDGGTQPRAELNESVVAEYAEVIRFAGSLPPVTVYFDGSENWLADGFHRYHAHRAAGAMEIEADVRNGTKRDAILHSVGANASHGLRRTNDDKRRAVMTLLNDAEWSAWSDREISRQCGVGAPFVGDLRKAICNPITDAPATRTVERNGKTYEQNTAKIGKTKPAQNTPKAKSGMAAAPAAQTTPPAVVKASPEKPEPDPEHDDAPDLAKELEAADKEIRRLTQLVSDLSKSDLAQEVVTWSLKFDQLSGRIAQLTTTGNESAAQAKRNGELLAKIRAVLGVETNAQILPALKK